MEHIISNGIITESIKGNFKVQLDSGQTVQCHIGGKIRQHKINLLVGDKVTVKMSPYDLSRGIIVYRNSK